MTEYKDLIVEIAKPLYTKNSIYDLEDLIQVGYIGVIKALQNFDEEKDSDIQKFMILNIGILDELIILQLLQLFKISCAPLTGCLLMQNNNTIHFHII